MHPSFQMFIFHNVTITVPKNFTQCTTHGSFVQHWQETLYNMFTFVCLFLLPLVIMIFCYTRILVEISSRMARNNCESVIFVIYVCLICSQKQKCHLWRVCIFPSAVKRCAPPPLPQQHPQSPDEDSEDEHRDCDFVHRLLDSLLPARPVVLAVS